MITLKQLVRRWVDSRGPRIRYAAYKMVVLSGRPVDTRILGRIALELEGAGLTNQAERCWDLVQRVMPLRSDDIIDQLAVAVVAGDLSRVRWLVRQARRDVGFPPGHVVWLAGLLASHGHSAEAGKVLASLAGSPGEMRRIVAQFPSVVLPLVMENSFDLAQRLQTLQADANAKDEVLLGLARLCFTFRKMEQAARLYTDVSGERALSVIDMVAALYARARADSGIAVAHIGPDELVRVADEVRSNAEALVMIAYVAFIEGHVDISEAVVSRALRTRYGGVKEIDDVVDECIAMLRIIANVRNSSSTRLQADLFDAAPQMAAPAVPKVFICGFGWSGSGAIYDDIRGAEGFSEFQGAGDAPLLNADSGTEATFIQADAGLGDTWKASRSNGVLSWQQLWDLLCLHVVGLSGVGYNDYKSCSAAANNLRRYGSAYVRPFRALMEGCAELLDRPVQGGLTSLFSETTEALCRMLLEREGGSAVLFNNAVFGREAGMLSIFRNYRAVVVFRDPLDVYVDRANQDKNHWRTPDLFADLYGRGLRGYAAYRASDQWPGWGRLREVPFERFVLDEEFRARVRGWLLAGSADGGGSLFDPAASRRNIGMHRAVLDVKARKQLGSVSAPYREMQQLAERSWAIQERGADAG